MPYEISTEVAFSAAHFIAGYQGDCSKMHGHNWKVRAAVKALPQQGKGAPAGLTYDFRKLKAVMEDIVRALDHSILNDLPYFKQKNPTAEAIAEWFYGEMVKRLAGEAQVGKVEVWESPQNCATYFKE